VESLLQEYAVATITKDWFVGLAGFHTQHGLTSGLSAKLLLERLETTPGLWAAIPWTPP
jgi:hypothetical protein